MLSVRLYMQALSESANAMLQVSQDGIIVANVEAVPKVWHGLAILHEQSSHLKVGLTWHLTVWKGCSSSALGLFLYE